MKPEWLNQSDYDAAPATLQVRELRVSARKRAKGKTLVTTIACPKSYRKGELKALYKDRCRVELNFRFIKTTQGMDVLGCRTPEIIKKGDLGLLPISLQPDSHTDGPGGRAGRLLAY